MKVLIVYYSMYDPTFPSGSPQTCGKDQSKHQILVFLFQPPRPPYKKLIKIGLRDRDLKGYLQRNHSLEGFSFSFLSFFLPSSIVEVAFFFISST